MLVVLVVVGIGQVVQVQVQLKHGVYTLPAVVFTIMMAYLVIMVST